MSLNWVDFDLFIDQILSAYQAFHLNHLEGFSEGKI